MKKQKQKVQMFKLSVSKENLPHNFFVNELLVEFTHFKISYHLPINFVLFIYVYICLYTVYILFIYVSTYVYLVLIHTLN